MAVIESPNDATIQAEVDRTHRALRATLRPLEHRTKAINGGHYRGAFVSGLTTVLNAGDRVFSMRWTEPDRLFVLKRILVAASVQTVYGTPQENAVDLVKLTGFTANDAGGTAIVPGSGYKLRSEMGNSLIADLRIASATAVTAGTSAVDSIQGRAALNLANTAGLAAESVLFDTRGGIDHPMVLGVNEGFNIRIAITQGAAGVIRFIFTVEWAELPTEILLAA